MFYVIYNQSSGALLDVNEGTTESVLPDTAIKAFDGEIPDMTGSHWDTTTLDFIPRIIPTPRVITIYEYLNLFSAVVLHNIFAISQPFNFEFDLVNI